MNFAVSRDWRRFGVGHQMVAKLVGKLSSHRRTRITLTVRETNLIAQLFFRAEDFKATEVLRGYYEDTDDDGYLMTYTYHEPSVPAIAGPHFNRIAKQVEN